MADFHVLFVEDKLNILMKILYFVLNALWLLGTKLIESFLLKVSGFFLVQPTVWLLYNPAAIELRDAKCGP